MLRHLRLANFALFENAALELEHGLTVLTGESGAGKSLLLDALLLLLGDRASPAAVRTGEDRATVEALFETSHGGPLSELLAGHGIEAGTEGDLILRREVLASGRSRAWVNGCLVPAGLLAQIASHLVEISSQHEQHTLLKPSVQRDFYDDWAGNGRLRREVELEWEACRGLEAALEEARASAGESDARTEFLRFQVEELENLDLKEGELATMEEEIRRLGSVEEIRRGLSGAAEALAGGETDVAGTISAAQKALSGAARYDPRLDPLAADLADLQERLGEVTFEVTRAADGLEADPERLDALNGRCADIRRVLKKHRLDEASALARLAELRSELDGIENGEARIEQLEAAWTEARERLAARARALRQSRENKREKLLRPLRSLLAEFAMPSVRLELRLIPLGAGVPLADGGFAGPAGSEEVHLYFSANKGEALRPLRHVASGGELSRVLLALKTLDAERRDPRLLVFDEIDSGVSGAATGRIAERLAQLGASSQVLCVTHQPAIAAAAHHHLRVRKEEAAGRTTSRLEVLDGIARQGEIARLLNGGAASARSLDLAAELLERSA